MFELLPEFLLIEPRRIVGLGKFLLRGGSFILLARALGHTATTATDAVYRIAKQTGIENALPDIYSSLPTWWVPESIIGCLPALILMGLGFALVSLGKRLQRVYF